MNAGVRAQAMGNAQVAVLVNEVLPYWNPAAIPFLKERIFSLSYGRRSMDRFESFSSLSIPVKPLAGLGLAWIARGDNNIPDRDVSEHLDTTVSDLETVFYLSFARQINRKWSAAFSVKFFYQFILTETIFGVGSLDFATIYKISDQWTWGLNLQHLNAVKEGAIDDPTDNSDLEVSIRERISPNLKTGVAWTYFVWQRTHLVTADLNINYRRFEGLDLSHPNQTRTYHLEEIRLNVGHEFWFNEQLAIRCGYESDPIVMDVQALDLLTTNEFSYGLGRFTLGFGIKGIKRLYGSDLDYVLTHDKNYGAGLTNSFAWSLHF